MASWGDFEAQAPALAAFGAERLTAAAAYLATLRRARTPRVHPVSPIVGGGRLFVFMEPTSPKAHDLRERAQATRSHNGVPDTFGTGGEFFVAGRATLLDDPELRTRRQRCGSLPPRRPLPPVRVAGRRSTRCNGYGDVLLPDPGRWSALPGRAPAP